jgi:hypothetical protein
MIPTSEEDLDKHSGIYITAILTLLVANFLQETQKYCGILA